MARRYSARKPYLKLHMDLGEFFSTPQVHIKEMFGKFSAFEKPYLDGQYNQMHLNLPAWDWGAFRPFPSGGWLPPGPGPRSFIVFTDPDCDIYTPCMDKDSTATGIIVVYHLIAGEMRIVLSGVGDGLSVEPPESTTTQTSLIFDMNTSENFNGGVEICAQGILSGAIKEAEIIERGGPLGFQTLSPISYYGGTRDCGCDTVELCTEGGGALVPCDPGAVIEYSTLQMAVSSTQEFNASIPGTDYEWSLSCTSGDCGSLNTDTGDTVTYTAPSTNADCDSNPTIELSCNGMVIDSIELAINAVTTRCPAAYRFCCEAPGAAYVYQVTCSGSIINTTDGCSVGGNCFTGFNQADLDACGLVSGRDCIIDSSGACTTIWQPNPNDLRTAQMITDGCCPAGLL